MRSAKCKGVCYYSTCASAVIYTVSNELPKTEANIYCKFLREKTFTSFEVLGMSAKVSPRKLTATPTPHWWHQEINESGNFISFHMCTSMIGENVPFISAGVVLKLLTLNQ